MWKLTQVTSYRLSIFRRLAAILTAKLTYLSSLLASGCGNFRPADIGKPEVPLARIIMPTSDEILLQFARFYQGVTRFYAPALQIEASN